MKNELEHWKSEALEQARLLGKSGSREAALLARIAALTEERDDALDQLVKVRGDYDKLKEAALWLARSCKDRLPPGHFDKVSEEVRDVNKLLSPSTLSGSDSGGTKVAPEGEPIP